MAQAHAGVVDKRIQAETLSQEEPQDAFCLLRDGRVGRIDTDA